MAASKTSGSKSGGEGSSSGGEGKSGTKKSIASKIAIRSAKSVRKK